MPKRKTDYLSERRERLEWLRELTDDAVAARIRETDFQGLEDELRNLQRALIEAYKRSRSIKHPRDKGDQREEILRHFLTGHGLLPETIKIPSVSTRMVSPSGHISPELDILFVNRNDSIVLKKFENTLEYYPVESVLGTVQVKSILTKNELVSGLKHIRKFKSIRPMVPLKRQMAGFTVASDLNRRFGVLFAYEMGISWDQVVDYLQTHLAECPNSLWPNMIAILDAGCFLIGDKDRCALNQKSLENISSPRVYGFPDDTGHCLQQFYSYLLAFLKQTDAGVPDINAYLNMPMTVGEHSVSFVHGVVSEVAECAKHGRYLKRFSVEKIDQILDSTRDSTAINWLRAIDLAYGKPGTDLARYRKQPGDTVVYDPDDVGFGNLLVGDRGNLTFESILIDGRQYWLPWHYIVAHHLIEPCPRCRT